MTTIEELQRRAAAILEKRGELQRRVDELADGATAGDRSAYSELVKAQNEIDELTTEHEKLERSLAPLRQAAARRAAEQRAAADIERRKKAAETFDADIEELLDVGAQVESTFVQLVEIIMRRRQVEDRTRRNVVAFLPADRGRESTLVLLSTPFYGAEALSEYIAPNAGGIGVAVDHVVGSTEEARKQIARARVRVREALRIDVPDPAAVSDTPDTSEE